MIYKEYNKCIKSHHCFLYTHTHTNGSGEGRSRDDMAVGFISYLCTQYLSPLTLCVRTPLSRAVLDTTLCDKVCQLYPIGHWFSSGTPVSSTNKIDRHEIIELLLKVDLDYITLTRIHGH
jgi:hypothetical protein